MIYIVHGDDFSKSRNLILNQQKKLGVESRLELSINDLSPEDLFSHTHSNDLFGNMAFVVLNISKAGRMNLNPYLEQLHNIPKNTVLVVLSDKVLTDKNSFIINAPKLSAKIITSATVPLSNTFKFVDAVFYKRREEAYKELSKLIQDGIDQVYEIFPMLVWGLRNIAQAKFDNQVFFKGRDFLKNKSYSQAKLYSDDSIKNLYSTFLNLDRDIKTGGIEEAMLVPITMEKVLNS
jgi:DNA polymerase III delta subunit